MISGLPHYIQEGQVVGWGPTVQEISQLARRFDRIHHIACLHEGSAPAVMLPYSTERIRLIPVPFVGGDTWSDRARVVFVLKQYATTILRELHELDPDADVLHVRCPAPVSLIAIMLLSVMRSPQKRWIKYAGNWQPGHFDSLGYVVQRWWLKANLARANVTVNGRWPHQPGHVTAFVNPCLTQDELDEARRGSFRKPALTPLRLIYVGRVDEKKGVGRALEIVRRVIERGLDVRMDVIGDGPDRARFESKAASLPKGCVQFHGWVPRTALGPFLMQSHLTLFPADSSEGWPKALSEGMAYGVVPIASHISSIPQYLGESGVGATFNPHDLESFTTAILDYAHNPERWRAESIRGMIAAERFTYEAYLKSLSRLLNLADPATS
jgi:glycosyltransferase involved in cell wall biosynthesis